MSKHPVMSLRRAVRCAAVGAVVMVTLSGAALLSGGQAKAAQPVVGSGILTPSRLAADLAGALRLSRAPTNLDPSLSTASRAKPIIARNGCNLGHAETRSRPCIYGDNGSNTYAVLFGDSHAAAWFPALDLISKQRHWRLAVFTKDGCPPAEVNIAAWFRHGAAYSECTRWRNNTKAQIAALHPALVIVAAATYLEEPEARAEPGVPGGYGNSWQNGIAAIFKFLHHVAKATVYIADVPTIRQWVPPCVSSHLSDLRRCNTRRSLATLVPSVTATELKLAKRTGISSIDPTSWFCSATACPVIVGHILLYRDNAHMTPEWSRFIAPVLAQALASLTEGNTAHPR